MNLTGMCTKGIIIGLGFGLLAACQTTTPSKPDPVYISHTAPAVAGKPTISGLTDLGSLPQNLGNTPSTAFADGRFSPGEWVMLKGKNLAVNSLHIDDQTVPVDLYYGQNPLFKIPVGLNPAKLHNIVIDNGQGKAASTFKSSHYIVATDTDGKQRHLIRTNPDDRGSIEEDWIDLASEAERPLFTLFSADSSYLFTVNIASRVEEDTDKEANAYVMEVRVFHAAAPDAPALLKQFEVVVDSSPIDATISANNQIVLLGKRSFTVIDANDPLAMVERQRVQLPAGGEEKTTFVDVIYFADDQRLAFLETYSNRIFVYDTASLSPLADVNVLPEKSIALGVDLEPDPKDSNSFWALMGPNYRLTGSGLVKQYKTLMGKDIPADKRGVHQLVHYSFGESGLVETKRHELDSDYAAYFAQADDNGDLLITTTKLQFLTTDLEGKKTTEVLKMTKKLVWDALSFGRVIKVDRDSGAMETVSSGVGIYYDLEWVPGIGQVFSLLKFGPSFSFPYITPSWGVGIASTGTYAKRKMNKYAVFPPYSVGDIEYQD